VLDSGGKSRRPRQGSLVEWYLVQLAKESVRLGRVLWLFNGSLQGGNMECVNLVIKGLFT
jgi:hypothetical protein